MISKGKLLISVPFMMDPNFKRSVILITDHDLEEGSVGFVLNQKSEYKLEELLEDIGDFSADVYIGGPVANNVMHFLHNVGELIEESIPIARGVYWGGNFVAMKFLLAQGVIKKENIRFFLGYSGWSKGQLQEEMDEQSWILEDVDANYLFNHDVESLWKSVMRSKGETYSALSEMDGDYIFN
ncbi:MAG: YqgE/AlgH family protein [Saprospiraceae bacterium]